MIFETIQIEDAITEFETLQIPGFNLLIRDIRRYGADFRVKKSHFINN